MRYLVIIWLVVHCMAMCAQEKTKSLLPKLTLKPFAIIESWGTYSINEKQYANRADFQLRRLRLGAKGKVNSWLSYSFMLHNDRLGESKYASTKGKNTGIDIWNACVTARLSKSSDLLYLHAGYFWAGVSKEYVTKPWSITSFDKAYTIWYLRNFITGKGNGIESGIGLGGKESLGEKLHLGYRTAIHMPAKYDSPQYGNPLYSGRLMFTVGDKLQSKYCYMLDGNSWGKRTGVTLGMGGSYQGKVDNLKSGADSVFFDSSKTYGADLQVNLKRFTLEGELFYFKREAPGYTGFDGVEWHLRCSYLIKLKTELIEPCFMTCKYEGKGEKALYKCIGDDITYDAGINWYINRDKEKIALHYVIQQGSVSSNVGDYIGVSLQIKI